jgi:WD40 repeat protein
VSGDRDGMVRLWTLDGNAAAEPFKAHDWVSSIAFSPDGTRIVSGGKNGTVRLWTLDGKEAAEPFKGHDGRGLGRASLPVRLEILPHPNPRLVNEGGGGAI